MKVKLPVYEMLIDDELTSDLEIDFIALVNAPAIKRPFLKFNDEFEIGIPHYKKDGSLYEGPTHKDSEGRLMTGAEHTPESEYLYHEGELMKNKIIVCIQCKHSWEYGEGGENPYKCNMCGYENKPTQQSFESYSDYPDAVKNNAQSALDWANENGWGSCGTEVGKIRANQLAKGNPISLDTIKRMFSYLSRHEVDLDSSKGYGDGCGKLMYDSWGGKSALTWAESKIKQNERKSFAIQNEEQRIISGPLMIPNQRIYRFEKETGLEYEVYFSPETIKKIAIKYAKRGFQKNVNIMHNPDMVAPGVTLFEIFQSDKTRGIKPMEGFEDLPDGTLFGSMYVENDVAWDMVKNDIVKGFSVEGNFEMKLNEANNLKFDAQFAKIVEILNSVK